MDSWILIGRALRIKINVFFFIILAPFAPDTSCEASCRNCVCNSRVTFSLCTTVAAFENSSSLSSASIESLKLVPASQLGVFFFGILDMRNPVPSPHAESPRDSLSFGPLATNRKDMGCVARESRRRFCSRSLAFGALALLRICDFALIMS